jgi:hypothetical protein
MSRDLPPDPEWSLDRIGDMLSRIDDRLYELVEVLKGRLGEVPPPKKEEET